jgi:hypothetical protein
MLIPFIQISDQAFTARPIAVIIARYRFFSELAIANTVSKRLRASA